MKHIFLTLFILIFLGLSSNLSAQENNGQQAFEVVKNSILEDVSVNSMIKPITLVKPTNGNVSFSYVASGVYELKYIPNADFTGSEYIVAEYYVNNGVPTPKYIHFYIDVKNSIIRTQSDFVNTQLNTPVSIFPLSNDFASHGPLDIVAASFVTNGSISLNGLDELIFTPELDFIGDAYINYVVQDSIGYSTSGSIKVGVHDINNIDSYELIRIATTNKNPATILLPLSGFVIDSTNLPQNGTVSFVGSDVIEYTSNYGNASLDTFGLVIGNQYEREVIVETIYIPEPNGFVIDDYVITTQGSPVTFDVQANDIKKNFPIISFTQADGLVQDSLDESVFTYTPDASFEGEKLFSYTVTNGTYNETGYITILISNFEPENNSIYNLITPRNTPLVINYDVPISNFSFLENLTPIHGDLDIYEGIDTIGIGCDELSGYNLVTYTPDTDFVGSDLFEILYCVDNNNCKLVKVFVTVQDVGLDSICLCVSDCVWSGDADADGKVSVADLLPIAYHHGESGDVRDEAGTSSSWFGQHADDWEVKQIYAEEDVKHVDSNGDGLVAGDDLQQIYAYYNRFHDLVAPDNLVIKDYPFTLHTDQDTVYAGEYLHLEVHIGSEQYPAINLYGLAYGLTFPSALIDSSSVAVDFLNNEWFGSNSPSMEMAVQPTAGRIEASFSRTSKVPVSGKGIVATCDFIIEDDIIGIKAEERIIPIDFHLESMKVVGEGGETFLLPSFTKTLYLNLAKEEIPFITDQDINLYPNPANDQIFIHANKQVEISKVYLFSVDGTLISAQQINFETARLDVSQLNQGLYFVRVETAAGTAVKKFVKE